MAITREQVLHVAKLAQLGLSEEEVTRFESSCRPSSSRSGKIAELDLEGVEPTSHPLDIVNAFGEDDPEPSFRSRTRSRTRPTPRTARSGCRRRDRHAAADGQGGERPA